jgi:plastocyanin domain-containing protein
MVEVTSKRIAMMCSKELLTESEEKKMGIRSSAKIFGGTAVMLLLATSLCLSINVHAQRQNKRKQAAVQRVTIALTEKGYEPTRLKLRRGVPAQVTFIRKVTATCATQIVIPDYEIKRDLPLNEPVLVKFTPKKAGELAFTCGMGMLRGSLVVQ